MVSVTRHNACSVTERTLLGLRTWPGDFAVILQLHWSGSRFSSDKKSGCYWTSVLFVALEPKILSGGRRCPSSVGNVLCFPHQIRRYCRGFFFFSSQEELALLQCRSWMQSFNTYDIQGCQRIPLWTRFCAQTVFLINLHYQTSIRNFWRLYLFNFTSFNKILHHIQDYLYAFMYRSRLCPQKSHICWQRINRYLVEAYFLKITAYGRIM